MLRTAALVLLVLWLLGLLSPIAVGSLIHALLVFAVILLLVDLFQSRA
ncbi:lmo0937 family membrane protein [Rheinheimera texasensis]